MYGMVRLNFGFDGSRGYCDVNFYLSNSGQSKSTSFTVRIYTYNTINTSAEWIVERPIINGTYHNNYAKTSTFGNSYTSFSSCSYLLSTSSSYTVLTDASNIYNLKMKETSTGHYLAQPGSISSGSFNVNWLNYY